MKDRIEFTGILSGFDEYVNLVLLDAVFYSASNSDLNTQQPQQGTFGSALGGLDPVKEWKVQRVGEILLNGSNIVMIVPGGKGPK